VLALAADRVTVAPGPTVGPGQFLYTESVIIQQAYGRDVPDPPALPPTLYRQWRSASGRPTLVQVWVPDHPGPDAWRGGLDQPASGTTAGGRWLNGSTRGCLVDPTGTGPVGCLPDPGYQADLPTDVDAMYAWLYSGSGGDPRLRFDSGVSPDERALARAAHVLTLGVPSPAVQRAVFEALMRIQAVSVLPTVTDAAGRVGIAVRAGSTDNWLDLIFDPSTYAYLGQRERLAVVVPDDHHRATFYIRVAGQEAVLASAIVNAPGDLP
jgi:hypothetical protein